MNERYKASRLKRFWRSRRGQRASRDPLLVSEGCQAVAGEAAAVSAAGSPAVAAAPPVTTSLATLLTRHLVRDGEIILLTLKPSLWTILFGTLPAIGIALIVMISTRLWAPHHVHIGVEIGMILITCRAAWAVLSWAGKLYLLTDMRIVRIWGVFSPQIHDIPLRRVARTRLTTSIRERLWRLGSIEIIPESDHWPWSVWQTVARPHEVHETIRRTIARAKQGGGCGSNRW
ncbi:MAG TPA: PH domain-containing protein [Tepidisphaeraceae bacterium]